ncbi:MAG: isochorismatase family protein [Phycisphaerae bacterium]|nr:isochorismatase family protein [Phycisphaerae bacterium]
MRARRNGCVYECVLVDLNTQRDFLGEDRPCRVLNAERLVPTLRDIVAWAKRNEVPLISSMDSHRREESVEEGLPPHCLDGSEGQRKLRFTVLQSCVSVEGDNTLTLPLDLFQGYQQVIFRKRTPDLLGNPKADRFLTQLRVGEYIIFGLGLERSVKALALGLLARNRRVTVISDGCGYWNAGAADFALRQLVAKGVEMITVRELLARKLNRPQRYSRRHNNRATIRRPGSSGIYPVCLPKGNAGRNGRARATD